MIQEKTPVPETKQQNLSGSDGIAQVNVMEEHIDKPNLKRRQVSGCNLIFVPKSENVEFEAVYQFNFISFFGLSD